MIVDRNSIKVAVEINEMCVNTNKCNNFLVLVAGDTATFLAFRLRNTKVVLIAVFRVSRTRCYCREYRCTKYFIIAAVNIVLSLTVLFCVEIIALFQYSLPYSQFSCYCCGHYIISLVRINTNLIYFYR